MKPEQKLWYDIKKYKSKISWNRLENRSLSGTPDLLAYAPSGHFFTLELKVATGNNIRFSPHQVSFHAKHGLNTFILVACAPELGSYCLYPGAKILELVSLGLKLEPSARGLGTAIALLESL